MVDYKNIIYELLNNNEWTNFYNILSESMRKNKTFNVFLKHVDKELYKIIRYYDLSYSDIQIIIKHIKKEYKLKNLNNDNNLLLSPNLTIDFR